MYEPRGGWKRNWTVVAAVASAVIAAAVLDDPVRSRYRSSAFERRVQPLIAAADALSYRTTEPRLLGFPYKPLRSAVRGIRIGKEPNWDMVAAASDIGRRTGSAPDAHALHAVALAHLLLESDDRAATAFERALAAETHDHMLYSAIRRSNDGRLLTNAAASFYVHAQRQQRSDRYSHAIASVDRALYLDSRNVSAVFIRAMVLERMELRDDARASWERYLELDSRSGWAKEAQSHLANLRDTDLQTAPASDVAKVLLSGAADVTALVSEQPNELAIAIQSEGLGSIWAKNVIAGNDRAAAEVLLKLQNLGEVIVRSTGDPLVVETIEAVKRSPPLSIAHAYRTYARATTDYKLLDIEKAEHGLDISIAAFSEMACPAKFVALVQKAGCRFYRNDFAGALAVAKRTLAVIPVKYHAARGRLLWISGLSQLALGQPRESLASYRSAVAEFSATRDVDSMSAVQTLLAEEYEYLGDPEAAIEYRRAALRSAYASGSAFRVSMALSEAGSASASRGEPEVATIIFERLVKTSRRARHPLIAVDALMSYAGILAATGKPTAASAAFREALTLANKSQDPHVRDRLRAMVAFRTAEARLEGARDDLLRINYAIDFFTRVKNNFSLADAFLVRSRLLAEHHPRDAENDLRRGLDLINRELDSIADPASRTKYLERRQSFFDELVPLLARERGPVAAFRAADEAHDTLLSTYRHGVSTRKVISQSDIPRGTTIVEFFISGEQVFYWVLTQGVISGGRLSVTTEYLRQRTMLVESAIAEGRISDARSLLREIDETLLQPSLALIHATSRLIVIPDRFLFKLPFAALIDRDGRYRVASMEVGTDVSAQHYLNALGRDAKRSSGGVVIVAIADGVLGYPKLLEVAEETNALRRLYGDVEVLTQVAGGSAFTDAVGRYEIAHIASHGFSDRRRPLASGLRIGGTTSITAYELAVAQFPSTRLVFLGACSSNAAVEKRTAVGNVASALLAAGVPAVIGVLWDVQDKAAREMAVAFHAALHAGRSPYEALRQAQLEAISRHQPPNESFEWAGYVIIGASAINQEEI